MLDRLRDLRRRLLVTADTSTSALLTRAAWSALLAGVLFGLFSLVDEGPAEAALQGTSFAVLMVFGFWLAFLVARSRLRRERGRRGR